MFNIRITTPNESIRLSPDGLMFRQKNVYVYLTYQEYMWLPVHHQRGQELTVTSEGGTVTILPHVVDALVSLINNIRVEC